MIARALILAGILTIGEVRAEAEVHRVRPGTAWEGLASIAKPGDEIVLEPGVHLPARLVDLAGEPGRPIVIRAQDARSMAEIHGGSRGLELVRPVEVKVLNVFVRESKGEGILVAGDARAPARRVILQNCLLSRCGVASRRAAVRFSNVEGLTFADSRVQAFEDAAIDIEGSREVRIERIQVIGEAKGEGRIAIRIGGTSEGITLDRIGIGPAINTAFAIGLAVPGGTARAGDAPLAARITIRNGIVDRNEVVVRIGSARDVDIRRNTILDPLDTAILILPPPEGHPAASGIRFHGNLVSWMPNTLKRLTALGEGFRGTPEVEFGANLWHSKELPAALPLLGRWEGRVVEPQVTDLDPRLDNYATPREPAARRFGFEPPEHAARPPGGSPESPVPDR